MVLDTPPAFKYTGTVIQSFRKEARFMIRLLAHTPNQIHPRSAPVDR